MAYYVITNGRDSYITQENETGKCVEIKNLNSAMRFATLAEANNIYKNNISKKLQKTYSVKIMEENQKTAEIISGVLDKDARRPTHETVKALANREMPKTQCSDLVKTISGVSELLNGLSQRYTKDCNLLSEVDREIVDIEHYIEFNNFNAAEGYNAYKMLQNALKRRRIIKNDRECLTFIKEAGLQKSKVDALVKGIEKFANEERIYTPRVLNELFE